MNCLFYFGILPAVNSPVSSLIPPWTDHSLYFYPVATTQLFSLHQNPDAANRLATAGPSVLFVLSGCEVTNVLDSSGRLSTSQSLAAVNHQPVSLQSLAEKRLVFWRNSLAANQPVLKPPVLILLAAPRFRTNSKTLMGKRSTVIYI